jgi:hypothetical protein
MKKFRILLDRRAGSMFAVFAGIIGNAIRAIIMTAGNDVISCLDLIALYAYQIS